MRFPTPMRLSKIAVPRRAAAFTIAVASLLLATGCDVKTSDRDLVFTETSASAIELMSTPRGTFGMSGTPRSAWLDPRPEAEFKAEHLPGAINLPLGRIETEHMVALKERDLIIVYDNETDNAIAMACAKRLVEFGYKEVYVLKGGLKTWKRDGNGTEKG